MATQHFEPIPDHLQIMETEIDCSAACTIPGSKKLRMMAIEGMDGRQQGASRQRSGPKASRVWNLDRGIFNAKMGVCERGSRWIVRSRRN
jgi:hypothetical protein